MSNTYALIENGQVTNLVLWDGDVQRWAPPAGIDAILISPDVAVQIGSVYDGETFTPPAALPIPAPSIDARIADLRAAVQAHLDVRAQGLGYDDIKTAVTYADEPAVAKFEAEGKALRAWRSLVWGKCYEILGKWQAGQVPEPTSAELLQLLPRLNLPG